MTYECPHCGEECEADVEEIDEISVWCENCQEDITDQFDVYADYLAYETDRAHDYLTDH